MHVSDSYAGSPFLWPNKLSQAINVSAVPSFESIEAESKARSQDKSEKSNPYPYKRNPIEKISLEYPVAHCLELLRVYRMKSDFFRFSLSLSKMKKKKWSGFFSPFWFHDIPVERAIENVHWSRIPSIPQVSSIDPPPLPAEFRYRRQVVLRHHCKRSTLRSNSLRIIKNFTLRPARVKYEQSKVHEHSANCAVSLQVFLRSLFSSLYSSQLVPSTISMTKQ